MKHVAERGYKDLELNKYVEKEAILEEEYKKAKKKLTEERIKYLVEERKLYKTVEEINESDVKEITPTDDIPEGEQVIDEVDIVEDEVTTEEVTDDNKTEETTVTEEVTDNDKQEETVATEDKKDSTRGGGAAKSKTSNKNDKK